MPGGCDSMLIGEEPVGSLPWDPLREQDWNSLGGLGDESVMEGALWEGVGDGVVGNGVGHQICDGLDIDEAGMHTKESTHFSPMTIDAQFDCFWDNFPGQGLDGASQNDEARNLSDQNQSNQTIGATAKCRPLQSAGLRSGASKQKQPAAGESADPSPRSPKTSRASARALASGSALSVQIAQSGAVSHPGCVPYVGMPPRRMGGGDVIPGQLAGSEVRQNIAQPSPDGGYHIMVNDKDMLVLPLFVTAIAEGRILLDIPSKMRTTLEQVQRKVSKEQNTIVQVPSEGGVVDLKMRVFAANSSEASAIKEYIAMHANQVPAPFVVLHSNLDMGVACDSATLEPAAAAVADRLRKKIKTHAVKILREAIGDVRCRISSACLSGQQGAVAPSHHLRFLVEEKMTPIDDVFGAPAATAIQCMIIVPTKKPRAPRDDSKSQGSISGTGYAVSRSTHHTSYAGLPGTLQAHVNGAGGSRGHHSPDTSQPSTPGGHVEDDISVAGDACAPQTPCLSAYFPVNLFVTAIADGQITSDTPQKVAERLSLIVRKVPKEQNTSVEISDGAGTVPLQMRVFVVNSEDAKAVGEYVNGHLNQVPAPFVVLAQYLPMAVLYDPATLDLSDASVADRLRKQAKTRAVKVLREAIGNKQYGITMNMLRGHEGATALAVRLRDALGGLLQQVDEDHTGVGSSGPGGGKYVVFAARNKATSVPNSPRKRRGTSSSPLEMTTFPDENLGADSSTSQYAGMVGSGYTKSGWVQGPKAAGGGVRRGGAATASNLHRNMLDRTLANKRHKTQANDTRHKQLLDLSFVPEMM